MGLTSRRACLGCKIQLIPACESLYSRWQTGNARLDRSKRKFSSFLRSAVVEFDNREPPTYPEGNIVEVSIQFAGLD